jgi:glutaredoxin/glutathione-dependent peroxiredoxin
MRQSTICQVFLDNLDQFKAQGVDEIAVTGVNDVSSWAHGQKAPEPMARLPFSPTAMAISRALGLSLDLTARGLGTRSQRYAMIVDDGWYESSTSKRRQARSKRQARKPC